MQNSFSRRLGPTRTLYNRQFLSYGQKTTRCLKWAVFRHFLVLQASFYGQNDSQKFSKRVKKMQNSFSRRLGPTRTLYDRRFLSYGQKTTRCLNRAVFKHFLVLQASFYGQNNLQKFVKRAKKMQNSFSRRLGPTRTLYDQRFSSYGQKTTRCLKIE